MNTVSLVGRIATDPKPSKNGASGNGSVFFVLAVNRRGQQEEADFIPVVAFNGTAKAILHYKNKGDELAVVGHVRAERKDDGSNRFAVLANEVTFLRSKGGAPSAVAAPDADIPF